MKRFLIVIVLSLLMFGCGKEEKNITVNIYEKDKITEETYSEVKSDNNIGNTNNTDSTVSSENTYDINYATSEDNTGDTQRDKTGWYQTNKDELKDISKDILENDVNSIKELVGQTKEWFNNNKEDLTDAANDVYYSDKEFLNDLYNKFKK